MAKEKKSKEKMIKVRVTKNLGTHNVYAKLPPGKELEVDEDFYNSNKAHLELLEEPKKSKKKDDETSATN